MKKILFLAAGLFASTTLVAQSFEASLGIGALASGSIKLESMYHFDDNQSFNLELRAINNSLESEDGDNIIASANGFAISPEYIIYFNSKGDDNEGAYLGPYLRFKTMSTEGWQEYDLNDGNLYDADFSQTALGGGLNFGWHGALDNGLTFRLYIGGGYNFVNNIKHTDTYESILSDFYGVPIHVRSGINIGYRF